MRSTNRFIAVLGILASLASSCNGGYQIDDFLPAGVQGEMIVIVEGDMDVELWRKFQPDCCTLDNQLGVIIEGETGNWYYIRENYYGDLLIYSKIRENTTGDEIFGWVDCKYVLITNTIQGRSLTDIEQKCSNLAP